MIKVELLLGLVSLALCIYCVIELISTPESQVRNLPKIGWLVLLLLFPLIGSIAWLVAGRPAAVAPRGGQRAVGFPEYDRPGRAAGATPESDDEFLRRTRERAEEQRRRYQQQQSEQGPKFTEPGDDEKPA